MPDDAFDLLDAIEDYVARAVAPLRTRIGELGAELAALPRPEKGADGAAGKDAEVDYARIGEMLKALVVNVPPGKDGTPGKDGEVDYDRVGNIIAVAVEKEVGKLPVVKDGTDGKDADEAIIVEKVLARIPLPQDGQNGPPGERGADGEPGLPGTPGERGQDGEKGLDGRDGVDGKDYDPLILKAAVSEAVAALPPPRDGRDGRDALDGLIDVQAEHDGERSFKFVFVRSGGVRQEMLFKAPIPIFRGVHQEGREYARGDNVTKNGCQWSCVADTATAPPSADWVQSTKAGRDGRDR